jgi:hypothetical protein
VERVDCAPKAAALTAAEELLHDGVGVVMRVADEDIIRLNFTSHVSSQR